MRGFLYVLWAVEDGFVKVGITKNIPRRFAAHSGNSSNPLEFRPRQTFAFDSMEDAREVEGLVKDRLTKKGFAYRGKVELFRCSPTDVSDLVLAVAREKRMPFLKNFPYDEETRLDVLGRMLGVPYFIEDCLSKNELSFYRKGLADAFRS